MKSFKKFFDYNIQISSKIYFLFFVSCFFVVNTFINLSHDDYAYAFIWDGEHGGNLDGRTLSENFYPLERVDGLTDILKSQYSHYSTWGGGGA